MDKRAQQAAATAQKYFETYFKQQTLPALHTIFIGCVDSRVIPEAMLDTDPGEMLTVRVPGALVHPQGLGDSSVSSAVELALNRAETITNIVVCGHTDCLALKALAEGVEAFQEPNLSRWLNMADYVRAQASTRADPHGDPDDFRQVLLEFSIKRSLESLREIEAVRRREQAGQLSLHGWYYDIDTGALVVYAADTDRFMYVKPDGTTAEAATRSRQTPDVSAHLPDSMAAAAGAVAGTGGAAAAFEQLSQDSQAGPASVEPESVEPASVEPPAGSQTSSAPPPVDVPRATPQQRVYASEVSRAERGLTTGEPSGQVVSDDELDALFGDDQPSPAPDAQQQALEESAASSRADDTESEEEKAAFSLPPNVEEAASDPALDDLKAIINDLRRPAGRRDAREKLNLIKTPKGWRQLARLAKELGDPEVRQAMREVAFELKSPASRAHLRRIVAELDKEAFANLAEQAGNKSPQEIREEFQNLINNLRNE